MSSVRTATLDDAAVITRLVNRAYRVEEFFVDGDRTDEAGVRVLLAEGGFLLLEEDGVLTGCVYYTRTPPRGYFGMLAVDPDRQGGGRGGTLIDAAEAACRAAGCASMDIKVLSLRTELPAFYERRGYRVTGTEPFVVEGRLKQPCLVVHYSKAL
jgi:N-acetylglutamate synthase-like GNAT family acetyltransferase